MSDFNRVSDFNRNALTTGYDRLSERDRTAIIDQRLRAHMLHIYNYMALGLAITGFAALGIYLLSVTGDTASAARILQDGAEIPVRIRGNLFLTPLGYALFASPLKWAVILAPWSSCSASGSKDCGPRPRNCCSGPFPP